MKTKIKNLKPKLNQSIPELTGKSINKRIFDKIYNQRYCKLKHK